MAAAKQVPQQAANENQPIDQDALSLAELAKGVLARDFRPRTSSIRRLAEGVLAEPDKAKKKKKKDGKAGRKKGGKKRKLARIPGQG